MQPDLDMTHGKTLVLTAEAVGRTFTCLVPGPDGQRTEGTFSVMTVEAIKRIEPRTLMQKAKVLFKAMAVYLLLGVVNVELCDEIVEEFASGLKKYPGGFKFLVRYTNEGLALVGYVWSYSLETGGSYIKHVIVTKEYRGMNFGALLIAVAEWSLFNELKVYAEEHANDVKRGKVVGGKKAVKETPDFLRRDEKVFMNFSGKVLTALYEKLGYGTPRTLDRGMILPSVESEGRYGHSNSLVKRLVGAHGKYLGLDKVLVGASGLPVANSTPEARDVEPPQDRAPSPTPAQRASTPMAPLRQGWHRHRQHRAPPPGVGGSSPTPALTPAKRARSQTPPLPPARARSPTPPLPPAGL